MGRKYVDQRTFWILVYLLLASVPLLILLLGAMPEGREFWREFSVALGFSGLALMSLQFLLTACHFSPYNLPVVFI